MALYSALKTALCGLLAWRTDGIGAAPGMFRCCSQKPVMPVSMPKSPLVTGVALLASSLLLTTPFSALALITDACWC